MYANSLFPSSQVQEDDELIFMVGFPTGVPLAIHKENEYRGWEEFKQAFLKQIANDREIKHLPFEYNPENRFPIGRPLTLTYSQIFQRFDLLGILQAEIAEAKVEHMRLDHLIWVTPTGMIYIIGRISFDIPEARISGDQLNVVFQKHYAELTCVFLELVKPVFAALSDKTLQAWYSSPSLTKNIQYSIDRYDRFCLKLAEGADFTFELQNWINGDADFKILLEDILLDVYFIEHFPRENCPGMEVENGYVSSIVRGPDNTYSLLIAIAHLSFVSAVWFNRLLSEQSHVLESLILHNSRFTSRVVFDAKLFRIFVHQFISDSTPISIRLTQRYMLCLEDCWKNFRFDAILDQVISQINVLEEMIEWNNERLLEMRNFKIGIGGVLIAVISITAVVAQLISTLDIQTRLGIQDRVLLILLGFFIGAASVLVLYLVPGRAE